jgi:hypothetical protein
MQPAVGKLCSVSSQQKLYTSFMKGDRLWHWNVQDYRQYNGKRYGLFWYFWPHFKMVKMHVFDLETLWIWMRACFRLVFFHTIRNFRTSEITYIICQALFYNGRRCDQWQHHEQLISHTTNYPFWWGWLYWLYWKGCKHTKQECFHIFILIVI